MASAYTSSASFVNTNAALLYDHDPGGTSATVVTPDGGTTSRWVDMRDYNEFIVIAMSSVTAGAAITKVEIVAADDTSGTNITVIKDSGVVAADAVGDNVVASCLASEIAYLSEASGYDLRYVAARITVANSDDEAVVAYIRSGAKHDSANLTATTIS